MNIAQATIVIRTTEGATHKVVFNSDGECISGNADTLMPEVSEFFSGVQYQAEDAADAAATEKAAAEAASVAADKAAAELKAADQGESTEPASTDEATKPDTPVTKGRRSGRGSK